MKSDYGNLFFFYSADDDGADEEELSSEADDGAELSRLELSLGRDVLELLLSVVMLPDGIDEVVMSLFSPQPVRKRSPAARVAARRIETIFFMLICSFCRNFPGIS